MNIQCLGTPEEGVRSHYGWLWATMWLLGFELRTFGRAVSALTLWAISPAPFFCLFVCFGFFFFFFFFKKIYFIYEYTVTVFSHTRRQHQIPLQMVVSHHVVAGNWTQDLCSLRPKDLFIVITSYTVAVFRCTRRGLQISFWVVVSHHVVAGIWTSDLRKSSWVGALTHWAISPALGFNSWSSI